MAHAVGDILDHLSSLPPFPKVTVKLLTMLEDDSTTIDELSEIISWDPSLVVTVLHLANSPFYMVSTPVQNVHEAVMVLGINTIKSITTAASIQKGLKALRPTTDAFDMIAYWRHSYVTAVAASKLARKSDRRMADSLYVVGMIHDIGKMVIAYYWPESWRAIVNSVKAGESYDAAEKRIFGWSHTHIGARLCANWQFPEQIIDLLGQLSYTADSATSNAFKVLTRAHRMAALSGYAFPFREMIERCEDDNSPEIQDLLENLRHDVEHQLKILDS